MVNEEVILKAKAPSVTVSVFVLLMGYTLTLPSGAVRSDILEGSDLLFELIVEGLGEHLEWSVDIPALKSAHFAEFKTDSHGESLSVLGTDLDPAVEIHLVGDDDARQLLALVLLFYAGVPVLEQAERLLVRGVVHQHHLVRLAQQVEGDVFEDVLASDIDHVQLDQGVAPALDRHLLEGVLTPLRHHVIVVELLLHVLVDYLGLPHAGLPRNYNSRSQNRHIDIVL